MVAVIEQTITPLAGKLGQQKYVIAIRDGFTAALPFMIIGSFMLVFIFPPFSADTTVGFARAWLDFSQTYREQLMLPFNLSMGVMTFFISVGVGASLGRQFQLDPVMAGVSAGGGALCRRQNLHAVSLRPGHFHRADYGDLFHPRLCVAQAA